MNRDFLRNLDLGEGAHLPDAAIESIMAKHGKTIKQGDTTISTLQGQLNSLGLPHAETDCISFIFNI